jgi:hypothetical protein
LEISVPKRLRSSLLSLTMNFLFATIPPLSVEPEQTRISVRRQKQQISLSSASY